MAVTVFDSAETELQSMKTSANSQANAVWVKLNNTARVECKATMVMSQNVSAKTSNLTPVPSTLDLN